MPRQSYLEVALTLIALALYRPLSAQTQDSAYSMVRHLIEHDTDHVGRLITGQALWRSGFWAVDGEYRASSGPFYKATGYWAFVLSTGLLDSGKPNAVLALYLQPYAGGEPQWLGAALNCQIPLTPAAREPARCTASEGATALLDLNFTVDPGVFFRFQDLTVTLTEPENKDPASRWTARAKSRGRFHLVRADTTASWR